MHLRPLHALLDILRRNAFLKPAVLIIYSVALLVSRHPIHLNLATPRSYVTRKVEGDSKYFQFHKFALRQMISSIRKRSIVAIHVLVWSLYITSNLLIQQLFYPGFDDWFGNIFDKLALILVFYINAHYVVERFGKPRTIIVLVILTVLEFGLYLGLLYSFQQFISPLIYGEAASDSIFKYFFWGAFYNFLPFLGFSYGYWYILRVIRKQQEINQLLIEGQREKEEKLRLAKERLFYEYSFLQAQINPHFLFNTLNFFYSRTLPYSKEVSDGIMKLSDIIRYALENREDNDGKVLLKKEIDHLQNVIDISQLRFENKLNIQFSIKGNPAGHRIIPLVLITLAENAFKHGDLANEKYPLVLSLCISEFERRLQFKVSNKKRNGVVELSSGIGMQNIRERLKWVYQDNYDLVVQDEKEFYSVELILNL